MKIASIMSAWAIYSPRTNIKAIALWLVVYSI